MADKDEEEYRNEVADAAEGAAGLSEIAEGVYRKDLQHFSELAGYTLTADQTYLVVIVKQITDSGVDVRVVRNGWQEYPAGTINYVLEAIAQPGVLE